MLQLLHALVLQCTILAVAWQHLSSAGHQHAFLPTGHCTRRGNAAAANTQEMPIDFRLWGHVGRGGSWSVDVGNQGRGRSADDGVEVDPNAIRQRRQGQRSLLGAGGVGPGCWVPRTRVRRVAIFHAQKIRWQRVRDAIAGPRRARRQAQEVPEVHAVLGAMVRWKWRKSPVALRPLLLHTQGGLSLRQTQSRGHQGLLQNKGPGAAAEEKGRETNKRFSETWIA